MKAVYKVTDIVRLGVSSLLVHKVRSMLTALGIIFGVWSVIAMLAISQGASYESQVALRRLGSDNIIIGSVKPPQEAADQTSGALHYGLSFQDVNRMRDNIPGVRRCVIIHSTPKLAYGGGTSQHQVNVLATEPAFAQVARACIKEGRFINSLDMLRRTSVCVVTDSLARKILGQGSAIGKTVRLSGMAFVVVGVLERLPGKLTGGPADAGDYVLIPHTTEQMRFGDMTVVYGQGNEVFERVEVSTAIFQMSDEQAVISGASIARSMLERTRREMDYQITVPLEEIEQRKRQMEIWSYVLMAIALVSLVVGGIGIMNIMLAGVTERTREIGIRRALGAKRRDIIVQFLVEATTLTTAGGLVGIAVGLVVPWAVENTLKFKTIVTPRTLVLPFIVAIIVGLVSGLYPATRAARLDPINALRHE